MLESVEEVVAFGRHPDVGGSVGGLLGLLRRRVFSPHFLAKFTSPEVPIKMHCQSPPPLSPSTTTTTKKKPEKHQAAVLLGSNEQTRVVDLERVVSAEDIGNHRQTRRIHR